MIPLLSSCYFVLVKEKKWHLLDLISDHLEAKREVYCCFLVWGNLVVRLSICHSGVCDSICIEDLGKQHVPNKCYL